MRGIVDLADQFHSRFESACIAREATMTSPDMATRRGSADAVDERQIIARRVPAVHSHEDFGGGGWCVGAETTPADADRDQKGHVAMRGDQLTSR